MLLSRIAETSERVAAVSARLEKTGLLAECLRQLGEDEIEIAVGLLAGELRQGRVGVGPAALRAAMSGEPAERPSLSVREVDEVFSRIATVAGPGSTAERALQLRELLCRATAGERDFLARLVLRELRQGALEGLIVDALARASGVPLRKVRRAVMLAGELPRVARAALTGGEAALGEFSVRLFRPVRPMLAQTAGAVAEALGRLDRAAFEFKLDGARIQVHKGGDEVRVFSRRLNEVTRAAPEVVEAVRGMPARELILDGEVLVLRPDGTPRPFQTTMRRFGRKLDVDRLRRELPLSPFFFDCLYCDGQDTIDLSGEERCRALENVVPKDGRVPRIVTSDADEAAAFLDGALDRGHEGVMAKSLDAAYEAGSRGHGWLKLKPSHTLDLVVLAAEWGSGRRRGRLSNLHLGARDPSSGQFVMLGKTFKGLTDEMLSWQTQKLQELETSRDRYTVYVRPELVVEIAFNDVQTSPQYPAGMALRFARVKRYRTDKRVGDADTLDAVRAIHERGA